MPKQTFYNLKEEKRKKLIEAAKEEFARVSLYEASISNILKTAGIPRGSFYQYFEDKEDAFFYLLNEHAQERHETFLQSLQDNDGDLLQAIEDMFLSIYQYAQEEGNNYIRNVLLNKNYKIEKTFTKYLRKDSIDSRFNKISELVNHQTLNLADKDELYHVLEILIAITFHNLVQCISKGMTTEEAKRKYRKEIQIFKKGLS